MRKEQGIESDYVKHTRNARVGKRGVNKRRRLAAKQSIRTGK